MKVRVQYSGARFIRAEITIEMHKHELVGEFKKRLREMIGPMTPNFRLYATICNVPVLLSESWPASFYKIQNNSLIKAELLEAPRRRTMRRMTSTYLDRHGFINNTPSKDYGLTHQACIASKEGDISKLSYVAKLYEEDNLDDEDLLNQELACRWTPLHFATYYGNTHIVEYLVKRRVNPNKVSIDEWTPLQLACYEGHLEIVQELLKHPNLQLNKITAVRGTGLHLACEAGHLEIVKVMLESNACMTIEDSKGKTPILYAADEEILQMLPIYLGKQELEKYKQVEVECPTPFCGEVWITGSLFIHDRNVFLFMDANEGYLSRYSTKEDYLDRKLPETSIKLSDIQNICESSGGLLRNKNQFYFQVETNKNTYKFYTKFEDLTLEWIVRLHQAVNYCLIHKQSVNLVPAAQENNLLDIEENEAVSTEATPDSSVEEKEVVNLKNFTVLDDLGEGAFGEVYKVKKNESEQVFAMKRLSREKLIKERKIKYAVAECKIMKQLEHPYIVKLFYAFQTREFLYLIMEYCPQGDLLGLIETYARLEESVAKFYIAEVMLALEYLHSMDILYRDLKPANVLIDEQGHAKLADFGLAKENVTQNNPAMSYAGTPMYLPPETIASKGASKASDVYGLGPMLYELITGSPLYYSNDISTIHQRISQAKITFPPYVSDIAKDFIVSVTNKNPEKRPLIHQLKRHALFRKLDWEALYARRIRPPRINSMDSASFVFDSPSSSSYSPSRPHFSFDASPNL